MGIKKCNKVNKHNFKLDAQENKLSIFSGGDKLSIIFINMFQFQNHIIFVSLGYF